MMHGPLPDQQDDLSVAAGHPLAAAVGRSLALINSVIVVLAAIAGFIQAGRVHQAVPTAMNGTELNVLAVAILGGASLVGGIGSTGGVILGVLFLAMLQNGLNLLGVSSYFFGVVIGLAILVSITMTGLAEKYARRRRVTRTG